MLRMPELPSQPFQMLVPGLLVLLVSLPPLKVWLKEQFDETFDRQFLITE
jgi:hypothetical protein